MCIFSIYIIKSRLAECAIDHIVPRMPLYATDRRANDSEARPYGMPRLPYMQREIRYFKLKGKNVAEYYKQPDILLKYSETCDIEPLWCSI
jgi:hypothetical protein